MSNRIRIIYCNQVDPSEQTGQGTHEREMSALLLNDPEVEGFYVGQAPSGPSHLIGHPKATLLNIRKNVIGFASYQLRLLFVLLKIVLEKRSRTIIFLRYAPTMIAPLLISWIFRVPMVVRTGPVLRNLDAYKKNVSGLTRRIIYYLSMLHYKQAKKIIVVTSTIKNYIATTYGIRRDKIIISGNGCNISEFKIIPQDEEPAILKGFASNTKFIMFAGSFFEDTGIRDLVNALMKLLEAEHLDKRLIGVLMGDGPLREELQSEVQKRGFARQIIFTGRVSQMDVNRYLNRATLCVVPFNRLGLEQTGSAAVKLYEYLAVGAPVLATKHADHQFIEEFDLGTLCEADDPTSMALSIRELVDQSPNSPEQKKQRRLFVINNGTWNIRYNNIKRILQTEMN